MEDDDQTNSKHYTWTTDHGMIIRIPRPTLGILLKGQLFRLYACCKDTDRVQTIAKIRLNISGCGSYVKLIPKWSKSRTLRVQRLARAMLWVLFYCFIISNSLSITSTQTSFVDINMPTPKRIFNMNNTYNNNNA